jgi:N4-gp56 family major capsid protein
MSNTFNDVVNLYNIIGTTFSSDGLEPLRPQYIFDAVCKSKVWNLNTSPSKGDAVTFTLRSALTQNTAAFSPTATTIAGQEVLSYTRKSLSLSPYGRHATYDTYQQKAETFMDDVMDLSEAMTDQSLNSINVLARKVMDDNRFAGSSTAISSTYNYYASSGTVSTMGALKAKDIRAIVADLKNANVKPFADGNYICILHPYAKTQLRADSDNASWTESSKYNVLGEQLKLNGDIGVFEGVRFIENNQVKTLTNTCYAYIMGDEAVGKAIGKDIRVASKSYLDGPHESILTIYWDALLGYGMLRREALKVVQMKYVKR